MPDGEDHPSTASAAEALGTVAARAAAAEPSGHTPHPNRYVRHNASIHMPTSIPASRRDGRTFGKLVGTVRIAYTTKRWY